MLDVAIVGAGPYGLSVAAHFRACGIAFRIFGRPMDSWRAHMPEGMLMKSDGFASNIYDPDGAFPLKQFCAERGIGYADTGLPVRLENFAAYGMAFRERMVPTLEETLVTSLERAPGGFRLGLDTGEMVAARQVILAVGITHFGYIPPTLARLPAELVSHSFHHHNVDRFKGRSVTVIGGGSSAIDVAIALTDVGADVQLVTRRAVLSFHSAPLPKARPWWQSLRHPGSGLGPGWRSRFYANAPRAFHHLPEGFRLRIVRTALGPSGGWFARDKVIGRVPLVLGHTPRRADVLNGRVRLELRSSRAATREILTEHVIAATGYRVDLRRLEFLSPDVRDRITTTDGSPDLSSDFESSVPGLYFTGLAAANSFGPVMRFAFGAGFAARTLTRAVVRSLAPQPSAAAVSSAASAR